MELSITVPFNHQSILKENKKNGKTMGILCLFISFVSLFMLVMATRFEATPTWLICIFLVFFLLIVYFAIYMFRQGKYNPKHDKLFYKYDFMQDGLVISRNSNRNLETYKKLVGCLYRPNKKTQYISNVFETNDDLIFRICIGTTNYRPTFKQFVLPKEVIKETDLIANLKEIFGRYYIIKTK